jgi:hypothetical protein
MKTTWKGWALAAGLGLLTACGGAKTATDDAQDAVPDIDALSMDLETDASDGALRSALEVRDDCHPHLFRRTHEVSRIINAHVRRVWHRVSTLIRRHPDLVEGQRFTWERLVDGLTVKVVLTKTGATAYAFEASVKGTGDFEKFAWGNLSRDAAAETKQGELHLDLTTLARFTPREGDAQGLIDVGYQLDGATDTKHLDVKLTGFVPPANPNERPPRDGNYVFQRTRGVGGSLKFQDEGVLFCPENPARAPALLQTVSRWSKQQGAFVGRADARATEGQIPAGSQWLGVTCFSREANVGAEKYWQMKLEDAQGEVVAGSARSTSSDPNDPAAGCDPIFGPVPALDSNQNDFDFAGVRFDDSAAYPYPGMP